ncbi:MAG: hypothetical protein EA001_06125 [Oscillatoriales cyanobacterium]|nr:MAG: hypothetical protein EA001_06125 [Oscillatoriales cyanobacterium]
MATLARTIQHQQGAFALILAHCNDGCVSQWATHRLQELLSLEVGLLHLPASSRSLLSPIQHFCHQHPPQALVVVGLEDLNELDDLLVATNRAFNAFTHQFNFPVILWVNDRVVRHLSRYAPDLKNRTPTSIRFLSDPLSDSLSDPLVVSVASC